MYKTEKWLNPINSASTGSIVCFDGMLKDHQDKDYQAMFIEIGSCHGKVALHKTNNDTELDFVVKVELLKKEIDNFFNHLISKI